MVRLAAGFGDMRTPCLPDPLLSWADGQAKAQILEFLRSVTEPGDSFVPESKRVAAFDIDGTLWCEKPIRPQADFLLRRWKEMVQAHPGLARKQPWKAVSEGDQTWIAGILADVTGLTKGVAEAYAGMSVGAFKKAVRAFFEIARHPVLGIPYTSLAYRPMRDLIALLDENGFQVYICSSGGRDFVRAVSWRLFGIPAERVIGSGATLEYRRTKLYRTKAVEQPIDDGPGKPVHIWASTGRKPLLAAGNADGDVAMLETAQFGLLIRHDDADREFAYDAGAEQALAAAKEHGWTVASMRNDFAAVFDPPWLQRADSPARWPASPARRADKDERPIDRQVSSRR